jgi:hypothetical protein
MIAGARFGPAALAYLLAGTTACAASSNRSVARAATFSSQPAAVAPTKARSEPGPALAVSVRPARGRRLRTGGTFWYWLEVKNVSSHTVAAKSTIAVSFSYAQGDFGGGAGNADWAPCLSDSYLILPGQTLAQAGGASYPGLKPGPATLEFAVAVRAASLDGTCADNVYKFEGKATALRAAA